MTEMDRLIEIMARLREPETGCPWDIEQTYSTIAPYTIEEAYEVLDAVERADFTDLRDELGDLLLQVVYFAQMAQEDGHFAFEDVAKEIADKMVRRHPHVFGDDQERSKDAQEKRWEDIKAGERAGKADRYGTEASLLDGIAHALPALSRAVKLQRRAARVGFDWPHHLDVFAKITEELDEFKETIELSKPQQDREEEFGDLLFAISNLARHFNVDPEAALRQANGKFARRFQAIESHFDKEGKAMADVSLDAMEEVWNRQKMAEKEGK